MTHIISPYALPMNGMTMADSGGVPTGTKIGPLMTMALWRSAMRVSTIWPLRRRIDSFYGPESPVAAAALTTIPGFPSWGFD